MEYKKDILTRNELADYLQVSLQTVINYQRRGLIHGSRIGRKVYYQKKEIDRLLTK